MSGEQFLNSIRHLDNEINALDHERVRMMDRRLDLLESAERYGGISGVVVQHSIGSRTESIGIQLASLITPQQVAERINRYQERINRAIDRLVERKERALSLIDQMEDGKHRTLITLRYLCGYRWDTVADLMCYDPSYVRDDLKQAAITAFETEWEKYRQKPT